MSETARDRLGRLAEDEILARQGLDCVFYYREQGGQAVERAAFDDGRVGNTYPAGGVLKQHSAAAVDVVDASAWPTAEEEQDQEAIVHV